jgi:hypothetical protein
MPIPTGTAAISFSQLRNEMFIGLGSPTAYNSFPLNDGTFRSRLTDTAQNAQLSLSALRGNAYQRFTIAADYYGTYDIRTALVNTGWTTSSKGSVDVVINSNIVVSAPGTGVYAMDTGGPWPGPSSPAANMVIVNNGSIVGKGGDGGKGGNASASSPTSTSGTTQGGAPGSAGGPALRVQRAITLTNYGNVAGGGGGGGGGSGRFIAYDPNPPPSFPVPAQVDGGSGGGGGRTNNNPSAGGAAGIASGIPNRANGSAGGPGTFPTFGLGGVNNNNGGNGGGWGAAGAGGVPGGSGGAGGAAGISVQGWSSVTAPTGSTGISGPTSP